MCFNVIYSNRCTLSHIRAVRVQSTNLNILSTDVCQIKHLTQKKLLNNAYYSSMCMFFSPIPMAFQMLKVSGWPMAAQILVHVPWQC